MDLSEKVIAVHLSISVWTAKKIDRKISDEIADQKGVTRTAGRYKKRLIPSRYLGSLRAIARRARHFHRSKTLPWLQEEGVGLLPVEELMDYTAEVRKIQDEFFKHVTMFVDRYPAVYEECRNTMKGMFSPADYPSPDRLRQKFGFHTGLMKLPRSADLPDFLQDDTGAELRKQLENYVNTGVAQAMSHLWNLVKEGIENLSGMLSDPAGVVRKNTLANLKGICATVAKLNITNDPKLEEIRKDVLKLSKELDTEELAKSSLAKNQAVAQVDTLLEKFGKYAALSG